MINRVSSLRESFSKHNIEAMLVFKPENCRYLSGFTGTAARLMIDSNNAYIFVDFRYVEQAKAQCPDFTVVQIGDDYYQKLMQCLTRHNITKLGFEADYVTYENYQQHCEKLTGVQLTAVKNIVENLRMVKDQQEIQAIKQAVDIVDQAWAELIEQISPGITEKELALELEFLMRRRGAEGRAFDFIVASGERGALPHGVASDKQIKPGELVTVDCGAVYQGYHSDMTRNFIFGPPNQRQLEIYQIVLEAQLAGLEAVGPGIPAAVVDLAARDVIKKYGYGDYFGHATGHGLGLAVHEGPAVSWREQQLILQPGMVITIEPGIYLPGWGGVRIEDTVLVTENGYQILTQTPKNSLPVL